MSVDYKKLLLRQSLELSFPEIDEKQNSEIPLELKHHIQNVLLVLKQAVEKFKISLILPKILENPKVLQQHLQDTKYSQQCLALLRQYRKRSKTPAQPAQLNPNDKETLGLIEYFQQNYRILNVLPNWIDDIDLAEKIFLNAFENVCEIAEEHFQRSAITDLAKEKRLHVMYLANEETVDNIQKIKQKIQKKKVNFLWQHAVKSGVIQKLEEDLAFTQYDNRLFVKWEIAKGQREIQRSSNAFVAKQQELEEDLNKARSNYEAKLTMDLKQEKSIQDERNKIQLQLQALIRKYDQTMYDKHVEEMLLQEEYNKQKQEFDEFLEEYKKEEQIYEELVVKQQRVQEAKALLFACTRAALKIQKWWKAIQKRRAKQKRRNKAAKAKSAKKK